VIFYYDNDSGFYESGKVLRIRHEKAGTLLTFKDKLEPDKNILRRTEIQTYVSDGQAVEALIANLGFRPKYVKEKKVENYELDGLTVEFHTLPFLGEFVEIEADENKLREYLPRLGLAFDSGIPKGYHSLFEEFCREHNLTGVEMTFEAEKLHHLQK
jgi:predicted adenylyl cyclase CyaB